MLFFAESAAAATRPVEPFETHKMDSFRQILQG